ncbi:MAG: bifunctional folylpolyglutamate synthase/dihydrofolate synthase [Mogibacterium sp.]|nr:bifunctional folylpolyglutamate synthase/dihydrofolate synthase [Mogibacterium sp.]
MTPQSEAVIELIHETTRRKGRPGLERFRRLLVLLGSPERELRVLHIAGTNGKGSVVCYLKEILTAAGYRTGVYTSPHVMEYNERFEACGRYMTDEEFVRYGTEVLRYRDQLESEGYGYPSEFEILTAVAFLFYRDQSPDYVILETGVGGRLDMTNIFAEPLITVITQVGFDHMNTLGDTLPEITWNKAGIIKPGVPVVTESPEKEVRQVIQQTAEELGAEVIDTSGFRYSIREPERDASGVVTGHTVFDAEILGREYSGLTLTMPGEHQVRNAITAAAAILSICDRGLAEVPERALREGLQNAQVMGRFEILRRDPDLIIDGAHNPSGIDAAVQAVHRQYGEALTGKTMLVLFGCFRDKPYEEMVRLLAEGLPQADYIATEPVSPRALPAEELASLLRQHGVACEAMPDENDAFAAGAARGYDITLAIGSIYLIGDLRILVETKGWRESYV